MAHGAQMWTACFWTAVIVQSARALTILYPRLNSEETLECECESSTCQAVFWYWQPKHRPSEFLFLFYHNIVDRVAYDPSVSQTKYKWSRKSGVKPVYFLKISAVEESDAGHYFCQAQIPGSRDIPSIPTIELRPGEKPPMPPPPPTTPKTTTPCRCRNRWVVKSPQGCGRLVLWPLVGVLGSLALMLIVTLIYFSRLPKKCRHRFVKKKQLQ